jgi:hypothetical protein
VVNATASVGDVANGISSAGDTQTLVRVGIRHTFQAKGGGRQP